MNDLYNVKQKHLVKFTYEDVLENVAADIGYFSIGFKSQSEEQRHLIQRAKTNNEQVNFVMADSLKAMEEGAPQQRNGVVRWLFSWLPSEFLVTAIREFTSKFTYTHCELAFYLKRSSPLRNNEVNVLAVGVSSDCGVFMMPRKFHNDYEWHHVACDEARMKAMLFFAFEEQGKRFSRFLMSKSPITPGPDDRKEYFCSHFTMACLERLPYPQFHFNRANAQSIDDIFKMVTAEEVRARKVVEIPQAQMTKMFGDVPEPIYHRPLSSAEEAEKKKATRKKL